MSEAQPTAPAPGAASAHARGVAGLVRWRYLRYVLMAQFYVVLALAFLYVIPSTYPVLAVSGLLFLCGFVMLIYKGLRSLVAQNFVLSVAVGCFIEGMTILMFFKYATFATHFFDLGIFMQPLYTTLYGHELLATQASPSALQLVSITPVPLSASNTTFMLTSVFSPMLFLLLPFYAVYPSAITLFLIQNAAIALPALFVFNMIEDRKKALWASLLYLCYAPLYFVALFDFHTEAFFPVFLFLAVYFMKTDAKWYYASVALFLSVNQAGPALLAFFLPYIYFKTKNLWQVALPAVMAVCFGAGAFVVTGHVLDWRFVIPSGGAAASSVLSGLGGKLTYAMFLLAPVAFVPLLDILAFLPAGAWLVYALVRNYYPFTSILFQYNMLAAGFIFLGLVGAVKHVDAKVLKIGIVVSLVVFAASWPQTSGYIAGSELPYANPAYPQLSVILKEIPANATVMASDSVYPSLANRLGTYFNPTFPPQWIVLEKTDNNLFIQYPYVQYYMSVANYTILVNNSLLFVARMNAG